MKEDDMAKFKLAKDEVFYVLGMGGAPRLRERDGEPSLAPDGSKTYALGGITLKLDGGRDRSVSVHSCTPISLEMGKRYRTDGEVWLTPWVRSGSSFVNYSVIAAKLVIADEK
uniref:Uncharacterized protein n=1 Tax=Pygoscelis antarcticus TaxID=79643 RepID=A0A7G7LKJ8_PYGAN|nr:hypothetical protein [Pygoscelis antarcticus]